MKHYQTLFFFLNLSIIILIAFLINNLTQNESYLQNTFHLNPPNAPWFYNSGGSSMIVYPELSLLVFLISICSSVLIYQITYGLKIILEDIAAFRIAMALPPQSHSHSPW